jgi:hypothetical protein
MTDDPDWIDKILMFRFFIASLYKSVQLGFFYV